MPSTPEKHHSSEELKHSEKKALLELRVKLEDAIRNDNVLLNNSDNDSKDISLWGVPLLPSRSHESTDTVLLKFLRARDLKVPDAFNMLQKTLRWRTEFGAEGILEEDLGLPELEEAVYVEGVDREGHPVSYNVFGFFKDEDLYKKLFGSDDEEKIDMYVRWRVQCMEKGIKKLSFKPGGAASMLQITDLKNPLGVKELRSVSKKGVVLLQDNYPEFVHKNIFINVSFRYYAYHVLLSPFISQRSKSKFIFARPQKVTETLLKFIAPEQLPIQYGGLKREGDDEFTAEDEALTLSVRGGSSGSINILALEAGMTIVWDVAAVGWEVNYKEEFVPDDEGSYRVLIQKERRLEACARNSFYINEPGKLLLSFQNRTLKRKKVLYRYKSKPTVYRYKLLNNKTS